MDKKEAITKWRNAVDSYNKFEINLLGLLRNKQATTEQIMDCVEKYRTLHQEMTVARKDMVSFSGRFGPFVREFGVKD